MKAIFWLLTWLFKMQKGKQLSPIIHHAFQKRYIVCSKALGTMKYYIIYL